MSEFGGRSELGRRPESDIHSKRRLSGDWSIGLKPQSARENKSLKPDSLGECKGESDTLSSLISPTTTTAQIQPAPGQIKKGGGDWSKDAKPAKEIFAQLSSKPADEILTE